MQAIDAGLAGSLFATEAPIIITSVGEDTTLPIGFAVSPSFPNPFRGGTSIRFALPRATLTSIQIYDVSGRLVRTLANEMTPAGFHEVTWNGRNESGREVSAGVYLYKVDLDNFQETRRIVLMK